MRLSIGILLLALSTGLFAQDILDAQTDGLLLFHRVTKKEHVIAFGKKVVVRTFKGDQLKGRLTGRTEDAILLDGQEVLLKDIFRLSYHSFGSKLKAIGIGILGIGVGFSGPVLASDGGGSGVVNGGLLTVGGVGIFAVGIAQWRIGRRFYMDVEWKAKPLS